MFFSILQHPEDDRQSEYHEDHDHGGIDDYQDHREYDHLNVVIVKTG